MAIAGSNCLSCVLPGLSLSRVVGDIIRLLPDFDYLVRVLLDFSLSRVVKCLVSIVGLVLLNVEVYAFVFLAAVGHERMASMVLARCEPEQSF